MRSFLVHSSILGGKLLTEIDETQNLGLFDIRSFKNEKPTWRELQWNFLKDCAVLLWHFQYVEGRSTVSNIKAHTDVYAGSFKSQ